MVLLINGKGMENKNVFLAEYGNPPPFTAK